MRPYIITTFFAAFFLFSCKKIVTLKLNNAPPAIVIQGEVSNLSGPYFVTINQPVDFYSGNTFPPVSGAVVRISNGLGFTDSLTEITPGTYATEFLQGIPGNTYTLSVSVQNEDYTAVSTMPQPIRLDSITFQSNSGFGRTQISAIANFQDPAGIRNYYRFVEYINGVQLNKENFVFEDRLSDGKYINYTLYNDSSYLQNGDRLQVEMYCIDANVYNYFFQLNQSSGRGAFNTDASPANPASNISNGAYGYFSAHTTSAMDVDVP
jgi:hypothetical protein